MSNNCNYCNKTLIPLRKIRHNQYGNYVDWNNRKYHKKCFKFITEFNDGIRKNLIFMESRPDLYTKEYIEESKKGFIKL